MPESFMISGIYATIAASHEVALA